MVVEEIQKAARQGLPRKCTAAGGKRTTGLSRRPHQGTRSHTESCTGSLRAQRRPHRNGRLRVLNELDCEDQICITVCMPPRRARRNGRSPWNHRLEGSARAPAGDTVQVTAPAGIIRYRVTRSIHQGPLTLTEQPEPVLVFLEQAPGVHSALSSLGSA